MDRSVAAILRGQTQSWPSFRPVPWILAKCAVKPGFPCTFAWQLHPPVVVLRSQTGLTANLQGLRIRHRRDGPSPRTTPRTSAGLAAQGPSQRSRWVCRWREPGAAVARQGLRAAGPDAQEHARIHRCPVSYGPSMHRVRAVYSLCACHRPQFAAAPSDHGRRRHRRTRSRQCKRAWQTAPRLRSHLVGHSRTEQVSGKLVGRTGFEPVTSSVSGKSRAISGVCHCRIESNGEPLTCKRNLIGSCYV